MGILSRRPPVGQAIQSVQANLIYEKKQSIYNSIKTKTESQPWQDEIDKYIKHGPGLVGNYTDLIEGKISTAKILFQYQSDEGIWERITNEKLIRICRGVFNSFSNMYQSPSMLLGRLAKLHCSVGEAYLITDAENFNYISHKKQIIQWKKDSIIWRNPDTGKEESIKYPSYGCLRSWIGEDDDPICATSELRRALPHIRELIYLRRRSTADVRSRLTNNDMLVFPHGSERYENINDVEDPLSGTPEALLDYISLAKTEFSTPYWAPPPVAESVPFPMYGDKPEKVEIGRQIDPALVGAESQALIHIAQSLRVPTKWLLEGPGGAKYDNEKSLSSAVIDDAIAPIAFRIFNDFNVLFFGPQLNLVLQKLGLSEKFSYKKLRCDIDLDSIRPKPDQIEAAFKAWDRGLISRSGFQSIVGLELLETPGDMSDWDFWKFTQQKVVLEDIDNGKNAGPVAIAAAVGDDVNNNIRNAAFIAELSAIDNKIFDEITIAANMGYEQALEKTVRRAVRRLPARDVLRSEIKKTDLVFGQLQILLDGGVLDLSNSDDADLREADLSVLARAVADVLDNAEMKVQKIYQNYEIDYPSNKLMVSSKGKEFVGLILQLLRYRIKKSSDVITVPAGVIQTFLRAIAGNVRATASGSGFSEMGADSLRRSGVNVGYRWVHGFFGQPKDPDPIHVALDGFVASSPPIVNGRYVGDHRGCRCFNLPYVRSVIF